MGLKDAFRSLRGDRADENTLAGPQEEAASSDVIDPMVFQPRLDGIYHGRDAGDDAGEPRGFLRFTGGRVYFAPAGTPADSMATALGPANPDPWVGEYTRAGRFTVVRRFERPVVHAVLESGPESFQARCTWTDGSGSAILTYTFVPHPAQ